MYWILFEQVEARRYGSRTNAVGKLQRAKEDIKQNEYSLVTPFKPLFKSLKEKGKVKDDSYIEGILLSIK